MMETKKHFDVRLFDREGRQFLIVPVVAPNQCFAAAGAVEVAKEFGAARHALRPSLLHGGTE